MLRRWVDFGRSRIGRRAVALFILCALVPLILCSVILIGAFDVELSTTQRHNLDGLVRNFGMTVLGRLSGADQLIKRAIDEAAGSDGVAVSKMGHLPWVESLRRVASTSGVDGSVAGVPLPNLPQQRRLADGNPVVLLQPVGSAKFEVYLVRSLPSGFLLYVQLDTGWLWADIGDFADDAAMVLLDGDGHRLASAGTIPPDVSRVDPLRHDESPSTSPSGPWVARSWEVFLGGSYGAPSWRLVALQERSTLLGGRNHTVAYLSAAVLLALLLITWLSLVFIRRQLRPLDVLTEATKRVAHRDFDAFDGLVWNDEFGQLAGAFSVMSQKLKRQFTALETLADVDRLMLHTPDLELILDVLLPRIGAALGCASVSVVLFDTGLDQHARAYDYHSGEREQRPVRRITANLSPLRTPPHESSVQDMDAAAARTFGVVAPTAPDGIARVRVLTLSHEGHCTGALCVGYSAAAAMSQGFAVGAADFADRLSLILANLAQSEALRMQANFDSLTGLQNRHLFSESVRVAVSHAGANRAMGGLLYLDLDNFKRVNDTAGHAAGDGLLRIVAERLALDDFGTGYSSLSYLRNYPFHTVKIDRSFVMGLPHDVGACRLAESIIVMCAALGKDVVAEGVDSEAQREFLRRAGCNKLQGYLLGRPMDGVDIPGFVRRLRSTTSSLRFDVGVVQQHASGGRA